MLLFYKNILHINNDNTWACLNMPGWYSSNQSTCQTNREPSMGWILNNMSAPLFHSSKRMSTWCFTAARGSSTASGPWGSLGLLQESSSSKFSSSSGSGREIIASDVNTGTQYWRKKHDATYKKVWLLVLPWQCYPRFISKQSQIKGYGLLKMYFCTFLGAFALLLQAASELLQEDFHG